MCSFSFHFVLPICLYFSFLSILLSVSVFITIYFTIFVLSFYSYFCHLLVSFSFYSFCLSLIIQSFFILFSFLLLPVSKYPFAFGVFKLFTFLAFSLFLCFYAFLSCTKKDFQQRGYNFVRICPNVYAYKLKMQNNLRWFFRIFQDQKKVQNSWWTTLSERIERVRTLISTQVDRLECTWNIRWTFDNLKLKIRLLTVVVCIRVENLWTNINCYRLQQLAFFSVFNQEANVDFAS